MSQSMIKFTILLFLIIPCLTLASEAVFYPVDDRDLTHSYESGTTTIQGDGQWWPIVAWTPSPPQEGRIAFEFDVSGAAGQTIAYAEFHYFVDKAHAIDTAQVECHFFGSDGTIRADDFDAGNQLVDTWQWINPNPGSNEEPIQAHVICDITSQFENRSGNNIGLNLRFQGDPDNNFADNIFNASDGAHWLNIAAVENNPDYRPYIKVTFMPDQDTNSWQMKQKDIHNTGRAAVKISSERMNNTFFDTILWQKKSGGGTGAFYGTSMIYFDGVGPEGADVTLCANTWPNHVTCVDRHTGKLIWQDTTTGGDHIGRSTQAFSNDGATVYATQDSIAAGHRCIAFPTIQGPGTNGANVWGNGSDTDPTHLQMMSPTIAPDGRIFLHKWSEKVYAGIDTGSAIQEVWASAASNQVSRGDTALYQDGEILKVIQSGRGGRISVFDGASGAELWYVNTYAGTDASPTVDPQNGNIYVPAGFNRELFIVGLDIDGNDLWSSRKILLNNSNNEPNELEEARSTGCLSHDGRTFYFQSAGPNAGGKLYAINTMDGSVRWTYETRSWRRYDNPTSSPVVTENGVIVVGNNYSGQYLAIKDNKTEGILLDTFEVEEAHNGPTKLALASAAIAADGKMYLPLRTLWTAGNGDGDLPNNQPMYLLTAFDLVGCDGEIVGDLDGDCIVNLADVVIMVDNWLECKILPKTRCSQ